MSITINMFCIAEYFATLTSHLAYKGGHSQHVKQLFKMFLWHAKSSTSFGWGKGGKVTSAGWQVTLCDLIWHVISRSGVVISITNCYIRFTLLYCSE